MRMLRALIKIKVVDELRTKTVLREHSLYCHSDQLCRLLCQNLFRSAETLSSRIACVTDIDPVGHLFPCEFHLVCIEDDDIVTAVNVRSEIRLVLPAKNKSHSGSKTAERKVSCVNDNPLLLDSRRCGGYCLVTLCVHCLDL